MPRQKTECAAAARFGAREISCKTHHQFTHRFYTGSDFHNRQAAMQKSLLTKLLIVVALTAIIGIALMMIQSTIAERTAFHAQAVQSIAADSVHEQTVVGPVLVVPYTDTFEEELLPNADKEKKAIVKHSVSRRLLVFPNGLQVKGEIDTDNRYRGIHKVLVYSGQFAIAGDFILPSLDNLPREKTDSRIAIGQPFVALGIDDVRGIRNIPRIQWNDHAIEFEQGSGLQSFRAGLHAPVDMQEWKRAPSVKFSFNLGLDGIERLQFSPVAKNNLVTLKSRWPHPQFGGRFMPSPKDRTIDKNGFAATWNISALATNTQQQLSLAERAGNANANGAPETNAVALGKVDYFSVGFIEPVNIYSQADRAVKYGLLFVALTFAAFFLFEVLKQLPIHPVQYGLVGMALALFFLLLVSLSEHIHFELAYLIASSACILLIGFYLSHVLRDWKRGFGFGTGLTVLYGVLFGLLRSEDNALMMGSILLFAVLSIVMIATRKVDWYRLGTPADDYQE
jgi:inner membrane protein